MGTGSPLVSPRRLPVSALRAAVTPRLSRSCYKPANSDQALKKGDEREGHSLSALGSTFQSAVRSKHLARLFPARVLEVLACAGMLGRSETKACKKQRISARKMSTKF